MKRVPGSGGEPYVPFQDGPNRSVLGGQKAEPTLTPDTIRKVELVPSGAHHRKLFGPQLTGCAAESPTVGLPRGRQDLVRLKRPVFRDSARSFSTLRWGLIVMVFSLNPSAPSLAQSVHGRVRVQGDTVGISGVDLALTDSSSFASCPARRCRQAMRASPTGSRASRP